MDSSNTSPIIPDFMNLSEIMEHYSNVPFEQFKMDLDKWFYNGLQKNSCFEGPLTPEQNMNLADSLKIMVEKVYAEADSLQTRHKSL